MCEGGQVVAFKVAGLVHYFEPSGCAKEGLDAFKVQKLIQEHPAAALTVQSADIGTGGWGGGGGEDGGTTLFAKKESEGIISETGYSSFIPMFQYRVYS